MDSRNSFDEGGRRRWRRTKEEEVVVVLVEDDDEDKNSGLRKRSFLNCGSFCSHPFEVLREGTGGRRKLQQMK